MDCKFMTIEDLLKSFYVVPDYQREYVWQREHVETLLDDIRVNIDFESNTSSPDTYFIGSIVVFSNQPRLSQKYLLIDGQQRMTTIFLIFCAIKARLEEFQGEIPHLLSSDLRSVSGDLDGKETNTFRIELNEQQNQTLLEDAFYGKLSDAKVSRLGTSGKNIVNAYRYIAANLEKAFPSGDELRKLHARIRKGVGLVRIEADDVLKALIVFETLNERGVGLDAFDLLKNLLYRKTMGKERTDQLTDIWESIKENIYRKGIKPLRFLRYFIVSIDDALDGKPPTERNAFGWFRDRTTVERFEIQKDSLKFAHRIEVASQHYRRILFDKVDHLDQPSPALDSLGSLAGSSARQHMGLMLTAVEKNLNSNEMNSITRCVESALFYSFSTRQRPQELETLIAKWTKKLQEIEQIDPTNLLEFLTGIKSDMYDVYEDFYSRFDSFGLRNISQKYRQKYILAKYIQHSETQNKDSDYKFVSSILEDKLDIEHIFPQTPSEEALKEFQLDESDDQEDYIGLLANLLLMESSLQKSCSNKAYVEKREKYKNSKFWMVKKFAESQLSTTKVLQHSLAPWPTHTSWNKNELRTRQSAYKQFAKEIWNFGL